MLTVAETVLFNRYAADYWTEAEHGEFIAWFAMNPEAGDVIPAPAVVAKCAGRAAA